MRSSIFVLAASTALVTASNVAAQTTPAASQAPASTPAPAADRPQLGAFGFDAAGMDRSVKPGSNFYAFANGTWTKATAIPADRSSYGMFTLLDDLSTNRSREILDAEAKRPGSKIGDFYASFTDEAAVNAKGAAPLQPTLAEIKAVKDKQQLAAAMGKLLRQGVASPFAVYVGQDDKAPDTYIVGMMQSGLGMPDRDYYLKTDAKLVEAKTAYAAYLAKLLTLVGEPNADARAAAIIAFETSLAQAHWTRVESRDSDKVYNKLARADFDRQAPGFDWTAFLGAAGVADQGNYLVAQPSAFTGSAKAIASAPLPVLKDYMLVRAINAAAPYLSQPFVEASFAFNQTTLSGTPQNRERWKRGVTLVKNSLGEELGKQYVAKWFTPETKAAALDLVKNVIAALDTRLQNLAWMDPATRVKARAKLAAFTPKIGYPDTWRDYSTLEVRRGDLLGNVQRAEAFEFQRGLNKLGKPIDRGEWGMTPMEINAYANPTMNEIVFPAAILQPPFFDPKADAAVNYGGIGAVIGHEISHHFDDQGSKYDLTGKLTTWWTPQDIERFKGLTDKLVKQYDAYEPLPGMHVQGALTLGENIADLAGLTMSYDAYKLSLQGKPAPVLDGFTGDQRFYLGWAQVWRLNYREAALRQRLLTDPHAPNEQRGNVVRNLDPWYSAFKPATSDTLYLAPGDRVRIW
ncbi:M13 family metallopeptidase [uncultured Sphingomonas sp.]|uniref:M13 family metallopeptidase n=1 Tax=uncultured Sphingomonas sp. TaxID=158754 RepID=UPI0035C96E1D